MWRRQKRKSVVVIALEMIIVGLVLSGIGVGLSSSSSHDTRIITELTEHDYDCVDVNDVNAIEVNLISEETIVQFVNNDTLSVKYWDNEEGNIYTVDVKKHRLEVSRNFAYHDDFNGIQTIDIAKAISQRYTVTKTDAPVVIYVPEAFRGKIEVNSVSGNVAISDIDIDESIDINTTSGNIVIRNSSTVGTLDIATISGDLSIMDFSSGGRQDIDTTSGDIKIKDVSSSGKMSCNSVSGKITGTDIFAESIEVSSTSGKIEFSETSIVSKLEADSRSGVISLDLVGKASEYMTDIDTASGIVKVAEGVSTSADKIIEVSTTSGGITIAFEE